MSVKSDGVSPVRSAVGGVTYSLIGEALGGEAIRQLVLAMVTDVPIPRTTTPDSPSRSKHCRYLGKINIV